MYDLYAADGLATGFDASPDVGLDPTTVGWTLLGSVDTRTLLGNNGQHGVSFTDDTGSLGDFRYFTMAAFAEPSTNPGFQWNFHTFFGEVDIIEVAGGPVDGLAGDFNGDGFVDAADYTVWRDNLGSSDESAFAPGTGSGNGSGIDGEDYNLWRANFGMTSGFGLVSAGPVAVPEPAAVTLLACVVGLSAFRIRKTRK